MNCAQPFGAFVWVRRHHCRKCGALVCGRCWDSKRGLWCNACVVEGELERGCTASAVEVQMFPTCPLSFINVTDEYGVPRVAVAHSNLPATVPVGSYVLSHNCALPTLLTANDPMAHIHHPTPTLLVMPRTPAAYLVHITRIPSHLYTAMTGMPSSSPLPPHHTPPSGNSAPESETLHSLCFEVNRSDSDIRSGHDVSLETTSRSPRWRSAVDSEHPGWSLQLYEHSNQRWTRWGLRSDNVFFAQTSYSACGKALTGDEFDPRHSDSDTSMHETTTINRTTPPPRTTQRAPPAPPVDTDAISCVLPEDVPPQAWKASSSSNTTGSSGAGRFDVRDIRIRFTPLDTDRIETTLEDTKEAPTLTKVLLANLQGLSARGGGAFWGRIEKKVQKIGSCGARIAVELLKAKGSGTVWVRGLVHEALPASHAVLVAFQEPSRAAAARSLHVDKERDYERERLESDPQARTLLSVDGVDRRTEVFDTRTTARLRPDLAKYFSHREPPAEAPKASPKREKKEKRKKKQKVEVVIAESGEAAPPTPAAPFPEGEEEEEGAEGEGDAVDVAVPVLRHSREIPGGWDSSSDEGDFLDSVPVVSRARPQNRRRSVMQAPFEDDEDSESTNLGQ